MQDQEDLLHIIALTFIPGIGNITARKIITHCGSARAFFDQSPRLRIPGLRPSGLGSGDIRKAYERAGQELKFISRENIRPLVFTGREYPYRLKACDDSPVILYTRGNMQLNASRMIAVVGTRNATAYGMQFTGALIAEMARHHCTLVSGLAYGIDSLAHRAAQQAGIRNIGVVAHGLDRVYPGANAGLAKKMEQNGGLVSDFVSGTNPDRENFPKRNRIVAGLVDAVVVVEASASGGALITAEIANSYNRDVFAVPGRIGDEYSKGCNNLIRYNKAALLSEPADLAWYMRWEEPETAKQPVQAQLFIDLDPEEERIVSLLRNHKTLDIDNLSIAVEMPVSKASALLLELEFKGVVRSLPGKQYRMV